MADAQTESILGVIDKRGVHGSQSNPYSTTSVGGNLRDIAALRARLTAISSSTYPAAVLNQMTRNDMIFAIRMNDEAAGNNW